MKICIFTENHLKGGVDTFLINLINAWPEPEDSLTLMCNLSHPGLETIHQKVKRNFEMKKYNRFYATKFAAGQDKYGVGRLFVFRAFFVLSFRFLQYPILFPWYVLSLLLIFRRSTFDRLLVVNGGYPASLLCRAAIVAWHLSGKSTLGIMNFHNSAPKAHPRYRHFENFIDGLVARSSLYIVTVSQNCLETLDNRPAFSKYRNFVVIHNGIEDPLKVNEAKDNESISKTEVGPYLLMLGTYEPRKGHNFLLQAFKTISKLYPDLALCIYGYSVGEEKDTVLNEVKRLVLEDVVELNDFTAATYCLIRNAKVLVVPSQEYESFNLTIIEAMACGTPIVATDVGGMPEVLGESEAGYIIPRNDVSEFANAVLKILGDEDLGIMMGAKGRQTFEEKYTGKVMAQKYRELII